MVEHGQVSPVGENPSESCWQQCPMRSSVKRVFVLASVEGGKEEGRWERKRTRVKGTNGKKEWERSKDEREESERKRAEHNIEGER